MKIDATVLHNLALSLRVALLIPIMAISISMSAQSQAKSNPETNEQATQEKDSEKQTLSPEEIVKRAFDSLEKSDIPEQSTLQRTAASSIYATITNSHLVKDKLDDLTSEKVFERYIEALDPNKFYFLQSDIDNFKLSERLMLAHMKSGDLSHEFDIFKVFRNRIEQRIRYAIKRLHQPFDFELDESYLIDREDVAWAKNEKELQDTWRKRIKNDILIEQINDQELSIEEVRENLERRYLSVARNTRQLTDYDVFQLIINAYSHSVEPHTAYLTPRASENFDISMRLSLQGIGAVLQQDNEYTVIRRIIPGGPAEKDGRLEADDRIVGVGQSEEEIIDVIGWRLDDVVDRIRGEKGTQVYLRVLAGEKKPAGKARIIQITRDNINLEERRAQSTIKTIETDSGEKRFAIINLDSFYIDFKAYQQGDPDYRSTTRDVKEILNELKDEDIAGVVIDLRNNGGGGLPEAVSLAGLFIEQGPIVQIQSFFGRINVENDPDPEIIYDGPLAVLINQYSASASEIFAGAIQDYNRGIIIGEPTFGKGTVQNVLQVNTLQDLGPLSSIFRKKEKPIDMGQINITMAQFFRVNGSSTQHRGVEPDIVWRTAYIDEETGERAYDNAIPWRKIAATDFDAFAKAPAQSVVNENLKKHVTRTKEDVDFIYFEELNKLRTLRKERKTVSLNRQTRLTENADIEQQLFDIENRKRIGKGEEPYESIAAYEEAKEEEDKKRRQDESPQFDDPYLLEGARILNDFIAS